MSIKFENIPELHQKRIQDYLKGPYKSVVSGKFGVTIQITDGIVLFNNERVIFTGDAETAETMTLAQLPNWARVKYADWSLGQSVLVARDGVLKITPAGAVTFNGVKVIVAEEKSSSNWFFDLVNRLKFRQ